MTLRLPGAMRDEIVAHTRAEAPRECCGLIAGEGGRAVELFRLTNVEPGNTRYRVDDGELFRVYREIDERDREILVIYHSHPATPAYPSATDLALAFWPDAFYVICSLADPDRPDLRAFTIVDGAIEEHPIEIAPE